MGVMLQADTAGWTIQPVSQSSQAARMTAQGRLDITGDG